MIYEAISVTELNEYIKNKISDDEYLNNVLVKGEISNFKHHYTGHMYFTIKDENSLIKCIMFKTYTSNLNFVPKDGMKVIVFGTVSVYERDGIYQIYCKDIKNDGMGDLYTKYNELKEKLEKEGLFNIKYKKEIPLLPKIVGVLTSQTGSVIRDIINVSTRRNPNVNIKIFPVPVQGENAGEKIAKAIETMNNKNISDVIILARGGGSIEDLWPFNEEIVARAIFNSKIPVISAVGHETDFTIADFVSDLRAPTPSAAAELAVPEIDEIKIKLLNYQNRYKSSLKRKLELMNLKYEKIVQKREFKDPIFMINDRYVILDNIIKKIVDTQNNIIITNKNKYLNIIEKLDALSPLKTLIRGYSITEKDGKIIKSCNELNKNDEIDLKFIDGTIKARVEERKI